MSHSSYYDQEEVSEVSSVRSQGTIGLKHPCLTLTATGERESRAVPVREVMMEVSRISSNSPPIIGTMSFNGRVHHRYVFVNSMCIHMDISIREYLVGMSRV